MADTPDNENAAGAPAIVVVPPPAAVPCHFDPNFALGSTADIVRAAALGSLSAQRTMRDRTIAASADAPAGSFLALAFGVEMAPYARICAAHGDDDDARTLAGVLCYTFEASRALGLSASDEILAGEAVAILERLAGAGDEVAADAVVQIVGMHPPAGDLARRLMKAEK
jgi:hypothetical protein